jgi:chitodextrinase
MKIGRTQFPFKNQERGDKVKRAISIFFCIVLLMSIFPIESFAEQTPYELTSYIAPYCHGSRDWNQLIYKNEQCQIYPIDASKKYVVTGIKVMRDNESYLLFKLKIGNDQYTLKSITNGDKTNVIPLPKQYIVSVTNKIYIIASSPTIVAESLGYIKFYGYEDVPIPSQVSQIVAQPLSDTEIKLSWQVPDDGIFDRVEIQIDDRVIATIPKNENSYTVSGLNKQTQYKFSFISVSAENARSQPIIVYAQTLDKDETPPAEIRNLKSFVYADRIKFTWENPPDVDFYEVRIYRDGKQIATAVTPANQFTDYDLAEHTTYTFVFHSVDTNGNVSPGVSVTETTKGRPRGKIQGFVGEAWEESVELAWFTHPEATKYVIYQDGVKIGETTDTKYTVSGLTNGQTYSFSVSPVNEWGEGEKTEEIQLTPVVVPVPEKPKNISYSATNTAITLSWSKVEFARSYNIYQIETAEPTAIENFFFAVAHADTPKMIGNTTGTSYTITNLSPNREYTFFVSAVNEKGESEKSSILAKTTQKVEVPDLGEFGLIGDILMVAIEFFKQFWLILTLSLGIPLAQKLFELARKAYKARVAKKVNA